MRVYELAKELNIETKKLVEKAQEASIVIKSHSSTLTLNQAREIRKLFETEAPKAKPKAFIVKKARPPKDEEEIKPQTEEPQEQKTEEKPSESIIEKIETTARAKSRLEIVRPAPSNDARRVNPSQRPSHPQRGERPPRGVQQRLGEARRAEGYKKPDEKKPLDKKPSSDTQKPKQPIKRHIISQEIYNNQGSRSKKKKRGEKPYVSKQEEQERISLEKAIQQKHKKKTKSSEEEVITKVVIDKPLTIGELSDKTGKTSAEIIKFLMMQGVMATVNAVIDCDTAKKVCENFELEVLDEDLEAFMEEELQKEKLQKEISEADKKLLKPRAPVVTIMGHVDHGKTTLLDAIRASKHKIVSTEVGGITQSIGAYTVWQDKKKIVFIDTPGHEAFTQMRMRGAQSTDIAILVVAADDGVMPQTIEAINHAKSANVPIIVAVNKVDKPDADADRILQQLTEYSLVPEVWGGDTITVKVSALQGTGIDELLEYILLVAEVQNLKAVEQARATGVVIEANLDKGKGPIATMLIQNGTMKVGDCVLAGTVCGKVRALLLDSGERVKKAGPSTPVEILGLTEVPQAGDTFEVVKNEKEMRQLVQQRKDKERQSKLDAMTVAHAEMALNNPDEIKVLNLIIKANTHGSAEAVSQAITNVESKEVIPKIIHVGVGDISEADIMLASASGAVIMGFSVKEDANALQSSQRDNVTIKKYDIIYQVLEDVEKTMLSLLQPEIKEIELGKAEVRQVFTVGKTNKIAGCYVTEGKIIRGKTAALIRNGEEIFKGQIDQLKRFKDDVKEVAQGFECGLSFAKFNDIQEGDIIEVSTTEEVERSTLV